MLASAMERGRWKDFRKVFSRPPGPLPRVPGEDRRLKTIYAFTPSEMGPPLNGWSEGTLKAEKLVDMSNHNYKTEPNVTITPDGKWVVFRSNMHGPTHVDAAGIKKTK